MAIFQPIDGLSNLTCHSNSSTDYFVLLILDLKEMPTISDRIAVRTITSNSFHCFLIDNSTDPLVVGLPAKAERDDLKSRITFNNGPHQPSIIVIFIHSRKVRSGGRCEIKKGTLRFLFRSFQTYQLSRLLEDRRKTLIPEVIPSPDRIFYEMKLTGVNLIIVSAENIFVETYNDFVVPKNILNQTNIKGFHIII